MGTRRGLAPWRWLFIIEFCVTILVGGIGWALLPVTPETAWFLSQEEKKTMELRLQRDAKYRGTSEGNSNRKWLKPSFTGKYCYRAHLCVRDVLLILLVLFSTM